MKKISAQRQILVNEVRRFATENYESGGWDIVIECWDDLRIAEEIKFRRTAAGAIRQMAKAVGATAAYRAEIIAEGGEVSGRDGADPEAPAFIYVQCDHCPWFHRADYSHEGQYGEGPIYGAICADDHLTDYYTTEAHIAPTSKVA